MLLSTFLSIALPSSIIQVAALTSACLVGFALQGTESDHWAVFAGASGLFLQVLALHLIKTELASHSSSSVISSIAPYAALIGLITTLLSHFSLSLDHAQTLQYVQSPHTALYVVFSAAHNIALIHLLNHVDHILTITFLFLFKALVALAGSQQLWDGDPVARSLGFAIIFSFGIVVSLAKTKAQSLPLPNLPEPLFSNSNNDVTTSPSISSRHKHVKQLRWAVAAALAPFCCWLLLDPSQPSLSTVSIPQNDLLAFNDTSSLDVVMAYYNEPIDSIIEQMQHLRSIPHIAQRNPTFITYVKGDNVSLSEYKQATGMDEVYRLPNVGREGDTYLQHILRNYNATIEPVLQSLDRDDVGGYLQPRGLAFQTFFLQVHMSWHWIAKPRCHLLQHDTGYLALGPYIVSVFQIQIWKPSLTTDAENELWKGS